MKIYTIFECKQFSTWYHASYFFPLFLKQKKILLLKYFHNFLVMKINRSGSTSPSSAFGSESGCKSCGSFHFSIKSYSVGIHTTASTKLLDKAMTILMNTHVRGNVQYYSP